MIIDGILSLFSNHHLRPYIYSIRRGRFVRLLQRSVPPHLLFSLRHLTSPPTGLWSTNLVDTDQAYFNVLSACAAEPSCPLYTPDASLASLQERVESILDGLRDNPLPVIIPGGSEVAPNELGENYGLLTHTLARHALFTGLYKPRRDLIPWFRALLAASNRDGREMYEMSQRKEALFRCDCSSSSRERGLESETELTAAIACSDAVPFTGEMEEIRKVQERLQRDSMFGVFWSLGVLCRCVSAHLVPFLSSRHIFCVRILTC
jgi:hypothetical protein